MKYVMSPDQKFVTLCDNKEASRLLDRGWKRVVQKVREDVQAGRLVCELDEEDLQGWVVQ